MTADFPDTPNPNVHDGTVDTGSGTMFDHVDGAVTIPADCVKPPSSAGSAPQNVSGAVEAHFDEAVTAVGGVDRQQLTPAVARASPSPTRPPGASPRWQRRAQRHPVRVKVTSGTTTGIDFRQSA